MKRPRMPHRIAWPFGYVITVHYVSDRQMGRVGLPGCSGGWFQHNRRIYVRKAEHVAEQCETIAHELEHASTDFRHWVDQYIRIPLQQESAETAMELAEEDE
jgi:hypothetical protein